MLFNNWLGNNKNDISHSACGISEPIIVHIGLLQMTPLSDYIYRYCMTKCFELSTCLFI